MLTEADPISSSDDDAGDNPALFIEPERGPRRSCPPQRSQPPPAATRTAQLSVAKVAAPSAPVAMPRAAPLQQPPAAIPQSPLPTANGVPSSVPSSFSQAACDKLASMLRVESVFLSRLAAFRQQLATARGPPAAAKTEPPALSRQPTPMFCARCRGSLDATLDVPLHALFLAVLSRGGSAAMHSHVAGPSGMLTAGSAASAAAGGAGISPGSPLPGNLIPAVMHDMSPEALKARPCTCGGCRSATNAVSGAWAQPGGGSLIGRGPGIQADSASEWALLACVSGASILPLAAADSCISELSSNTDATLMATTLARGPVSASEYLGSLQPADPARGRPCCRCQRSLVDAVGESTLALWHMQDCGAFEATFLRRLQAAVPAPSFAK